MMELLDDYSQSPMLNESNVHSTKQRTKIENDSVHQCTSPRIRNDDRKLPRMFYIGDNDVIVVADEYCTCGNIFVLCEDNNILEVCYNRGVEVAVKLKKGAD